MHTKEGEPNHAMTNPNTHAKLRCTTQATALEMLAKDKPSKVIKTLKADTASPASINLALAALEAAHGREAVALFISNLWATKSNAGQYAIQKEMDTNWIADQLSNIG